MTGTPARLVEDLSFSNRAVVARISAGNTTLIAKRPFEREALAREVEALRVLPAATRPALVGASDEVVVMEDLGTGPSLADLLLGSDRAGAERALLAWAATLGTALRATLRTGAAHEPLDLGEGLVELVGLASDLAVPVPSGLDDDAAAIEHALSTSSPWLAYCPGDTCPDNNRVLADGSVRFFDFEGSGWRHGATEAAYCRAPFCTCWCVALLPPGLTGAMEEAFMGTLDPPEPEAFRSTVDLAAASWTVMSFDYFRRAVHDGRPIGPKGRAPGDARQYLLLRLTALEAMSERLPALAALATGLADEIRRRWPEAAEPATYPAFG
jgi:hypothetical protein